MVLCRWPWWAVKRERFDPRMLSAARLNSNWSAARTPEAKVQRKEAVSRMFDSSRHLPSEWEAWGSTAIPIAIPMTSAGGTWLKLGHQIGHHIVALNQGKPARKFRLSRNAPDGWSPLQTRSHERWKQDVTIARTGRAPNAVAD